MISYYKEFSMKGPDRQVKSHIHVQTPRTVYKCEIFN